MRRHGHVPDSYRAATFLLALLAACASTSLQSTWKDPDWSGAPLHELLVVGVSAQPTVRRAFEDAFATRLREAGIEAVASYTLIPDAGEIGRPALEQAVAQVSADGVLITSLAKVETKTEMTPGYVAGPPVAGGFYGGYSVAWGTHYEPPRVYQYQVVTLETKLYAVDGARLVWSGTTETFSPKDVAQETRGFADVIIRSLRSQGLI